MADAPKAPIATELSGKVVFNRGLRTFHLWPLCDKKGNVLKTRTLAPDGQVECLAPVLDEEGKTIHDEYKYLTESFKREVVDIEKMSKPVAKTIAEQEAKIAELQDKIRELTGQLADATKDSKKKDK